MTVTTPVTARQAPSPTTPPAPTTPLLPLTPTTPLTATPAAPAAPQSVDTLCAYCGVGCGLTLSSDSEGKLTSRGTPGHPANQGRLCTKGATTADLLTAGGRQTTALVDGAPTDTDTAIAEVAQRFTDLRRDHGDDAVALYVSGQMSLEAQYLANKLAKGYLRTNYIESNSRLCMAGAATGYKQSLGADGPPGSYDDIDEAEVFLVIGSNMADCHPILFLRMMDRVKQGAKLIVVDPRRTATAAKADLYLPVRPGTDMALLNGLLRLIVDAGNTDPEFIEEFTEGWEVMTEHLADYPADTVAEITGIPEQDIRTAAEWIGGTRKFLSLWTMGLNQSIHGTWHTTALCNLHLATGTICRTGAGPLSLTGQSNAMGGREMGYMGPGLPGQRSVLDENDRAEVEGIWGLPAGTLHTRLGEGTVDLFRSLAEGTTKALWVICTNPVSSMANRSRVVEALDQAECVVVQDAFAGTDTAAHSDIVLPAALWTESSGVMVNSERNLTLSTPLLDAPGGALPDWKLICQVAQAMGFTGFDFPDAAAVFDEIRQFHNPRTGWDLRGIDHERLRSGPVQWPAPPVESGASRTSGTPETEGSDTAGHMDGTGQNRDSGSTSRHPVRYLNDGISQHLHVTADGSIPRLAFPTPTRRARFHARPYLPPAEQPDPDFPVILTTGRLPHQWHTMTKTKLVKKLMRLNPSSFLQVHPTDARPLGIADGDMVEVTSRRGSVRAPAVVTEDIVPGTCFIPMHFAEVPVNEITNDIVDPESLQPEFKACAVALRPVKPVTPDTPATPEAASSEMASLMGTMTAEAQPGTETPPPEAALAGAMAPTTSMDARLHAGTDQLAEVIGSIPSITEWTPEQRSWVEGMVHALRVSPPQDAVPTLPAHTPLPDESRAWVDGLLAGLFSRRPLTGSSVGILSDAPGASDAAPRVGAMTAAGTGVEDARAAGTSGSTGTTSTFRPTAGTTPHTDTVTLVWASQTGTVEEFLPTAVASLTAAGVSTRECCADQIAIEELRGTVLFIVSSTGDGEAPDNALGLWSTLTTGDSDLSELRYAVLGFGDSSYTDFCGFARRLENRLDELGAQPLTQRVSCEPDYDQVAGAWVDTVTALLAGEEGASSVAATAPAAPTTHPTGGPVGDPASTPGNSVGIPTGRSASNPTSTPTYSRRNPLSSELLEASCLTAKSPDRDIRRYSFALPRDATGTFEYNVGDALGIWPRNNPKMVEEWLSLTGMDAATVVPSRDGTEDIPLHQALRDHLDITSITPGLLRLIDRYHPAAGLAAIAETPEEVGEFSQGIQAVDVLTAHPVRVSIEQWLEVLTPLTPRLYSISSSPLDDPHRVEITVSTLYLTEPGTSPATASDSPTSSYQPTRPRRGVCSGYLADTAPGEQVRIFLRPNRAFAPPTQSDTPMIMIGPGTGVAPFRGFLHHRAQCGDTGENWLFFGERHAATDFLYRDELTELHRRGTLTTLSTAFSRDQAEKVYVQDRMYDQASELWSWITRGAHIYVCGDASRMAADVHRALVEIISEQGRMTPEEARAFLTQMSGQRRYIRDVY